MQSKEDANGVGSANALKLNRFLNRELYQNPLSCRDFPT
jgi:hypothetical protein